MYAIGLSNFTLKICCFFLALPIIKMSFILVEYILIWRGQSHTNVVGVADFQFRFVL